MKRYFQIDDYTIVDKAGNKNNWVYYFYRNFELTFYCKNPAIRFHNSIVLGNEAKEAWVDLLDRVNNESNSNYYI